MKTKNKSSLKSIGLVLAVLLFSTLMYGKVCYSEGIENKIPTFSEETSKMEYLSIMDLESVDMWRKKAGDTTTLVPAYAITKNGNKVIYYGTLYRGVGYQSYTSCKSGLRVDVYTVKGKSLCNTNIIVTVEWLRNQIRLYRIIERVNMIDGNGNFIILDLDGDGTFETLMDPSKWYEESSCLNDWTLKDFLDLKHSEG